MQNILASENIDKGKSILGAPPKQDKKEIQNPRAKKGKTQKPKQKKQHLCHHCGAARHTRSNCYKWLAIQQSNNMISSGNQNQFPSSFAPFGDFLKVLIFLLNLNGFNSFPSPLDQEFAKRKDSSKAWKEKTPSDLVTFFSLSSSCFCFCITSVFCFLVLSQFSFMHCFFNMFLFVYFSVLFYFSFH